MAEHSKKSVIFSVLALLAFSFLSVILSSCATNKEEVTDFRSYYFPLDSLVNGLVYEYQSLQDESSEYWFYKKFQKGDSLLLLGQNFDQFLQIRQFQKELISEKGVKLESLELFDYDSSGIRTTNVNISSDDLFSFHPMDSTEKLIYHINWQDSLQGMGVELIKNRYQDQIYETQFKGRHIKYLKTRVSELVSTNQDGHLDLEWYGEEWYGAGVGLIYYMKETPSGEKFEYQLINRTDMQVFLEEREYE